MTPLYYTDSISLQGLSHMSSERNEEAGFTTCCTPESNLINILLRANFELTFSQVLLLFSLAFL